METHVGNDHPDNSLKVQAFQMHGQTVPTHNFTLRDPLNCPRSDSAPQTTREVRLSFQCREGVVPSTWQPRCSVWANKLMFRVSHIYLLMNCLI